MLLQIDLRADADQGQRADRSFHRLSLVSLAVCLQTPLRQDHVSPKAPPTSRIDFVMTPILEHKELMTSSVQGLRESELSPYYQRVDLWR